MPSLRGPRNAHAIRDEHDDSLSKGLHATEHEGEDKHDACFHVSFHNNLLLFLRRLPYTTGLM